MDIADHIQKVAEVGGDGVAIDLDGKTLSWAALGRAATELRDRLSNAGHGDDTPVGLLGRNRLEQIGSFIALLGAGRAVVLINAMRHSGLVAEEIDDLGLGVLVGEGADLSPEVLAAAGRRGTMVVRATAEAGNLAYDVVRSGSDGPFRARDPDTLIEIQTSGTTGKPKRIAISERTVADSLRDGVRKSTGAVEQGELTLKSSPTLMFGPLVHTSGTFNTLMSVFEARPIILFEKFDASKYRDALVRYRPKFAALPPTALKMILDSDSTRDDFSSVLAVRAGTAPLPVDLQVAFEEKFGVPVLTTYGATEFLGVATSWTLDDHRKFGALKRGSVGRASKGVQLRIVDPATGSELHAGEEGIVEVKLDRIDGGKDWIRTTDLGRLDGDGFLYIVGRADDAIIRGGFKVLAGKVADALLGFPGVYDAIVLGRPDERLGEVPVAVIEPYAGMIVDETALRAFARERLSPYEVPVRFHIVEKLPRTVSDKVVRPEVKRLLDAFEA